VAQIARGRFSIISKTYVKDESMGGEMMASKAILVDSETEADASREYEMLRSLANERIVQLHAASRGATLFVMAMERLSGIDVMTFLSTRKTYNEELVAQIINQVLDGLEYLHFRGICMVELQPDNVVMVNSRKADIKLVDFATARHVPVGGAKVDSKTIPEYSAPEVLKKQDVSPATDIWCVGVLTYILLSGVSPFRGETDADTIENVGFVRFHFDHLYKEVNKEVVRFLLLVFKRTPEKRPAVAECVDHKWLCPDDYMLKKREKAIFTSTKLSEFADEFHAKKSNATPAKLLSAGGISLTRSVSLEEDKMEEF
jgi:serine/threonine protein kinase